MAVLFRSFCGMNQLFSAASRQENHEQEKPHRIA
jgi:hypothetical protein